MIELSIKQNTRSESGQQISKKELSQCVIEQLAIQILLVQILVNLEYTVQCE